MLHQGKLPVEKRLEVVEGIMRGRGQQVHSKNNIS